MYILMWGFMLVFIVFFIGLWIVEWNMVGMKNMKKEVSKDFWRFMVMRYVNIIYYCKKRYVYVLYLNVWVYCMWFECGGGICV